jgi:transcriptional regulator with GAF, ATPase, and Fis domain
LDTFMKVADTTWQTQQQDDSAVHHPDLDHVVAHLWFLTTASPSAHLIDGKGLSIGRVGGDCQVQIDDRKMSRRHARIECGSTGWHLQDLGARNRGFVNGRGYGAGERVALSDGSVLRLADTVAVFRDGALAADARSDSTVFPGISPNAVAVRRRVEALAAGSGHVLILGETGTGKERVAREIGEQRAPHPFVALNCAELSGELARSELFGQLRGAYTDARARPGLVDAAGDGALFLDEIGELSLEVQADLLRFLEDGSYRPVGGDELRRSTARLIAATNVDLDREVLRGGFRRDLLARLRASNAPLELPPLRDRREDIPGWTQVFLRELGRELGPSHPWEVGALECLLLYPWSENLRELHRVVGHAASEAAAFPCGKQHLPAEVRAFRGTLRSPPGPEPEPSGPPEPLEPRPDPTQPELVEALRAINGNARAAARVLGIDRRKLYRLAERFGIEIESFRQKVKPGGS